MIPSHPWPSDFPDVWCSVTTDQLQQHPAFSRAKCGDLEEAHRLANDLVDRNQIHQLGNRFSNARLVVVNSGEHNGNKIPLAFASIFSAVTGCPLDARVLKANISTHTSGSAHFRFAHRARFFGNIEPGNNYLLLDDVVTQGGQLSELRQYVYSNGGVVVGVTCLAYTQGKIMNSRKLAPKSETLGALVRKHGRESLSSTLRELGVYGGNIHALTESEALMILREPDLNTFRRRIKDAAKPIELLESGFITVRKPHLRRG